MPIDNKARLASTLLIPVLLASCASTSENEEPSEQTAFLDLYSIEGDEGRDCISRSAIRSIRVIGDRTIEFNMRGGESYVNILPNTCPGLRPGRTISYETRQSRLCKLDIIRLFDQSATGLRPTISCGLGKFNEVVQGGVVLDDDD